MNYRYAVNATRLKTRCATFTFVLENGVASVRLVLSSETLATRRELKRGNIAL